MTRTTFALGAVFTLALLGGCAPYGAYDNGYHGGGGVGYYAPDYYAAPYGQPYGGYGGGYGRGYQQDRDHRQGGDHAGYRGQDQNRDRAPDQARNQDRGDRQNYNRAPENRGAEQRAPGNTNTLPNGDRITRGNFWQQNHPEMNAAPAQQQQPANNAGQAGGGMGRGFRGRDGANAN